MRHFEFTGPTPGSPATKIDFADFKSIYLTSKATASHAVLTDADGKKHVISAPANDTSQLVAPGQAHVEFRGKAPFTLVLTGDADTFFRVDG